MAQDNEHISSGINESRQANRRSASLKTLYGALFKSRRRQARRTEDRINTYLDWHGHLPVITTIIIILLCFADAFLTTILLSKGAVEMNILMDWLIQKDLQTFTIVKMAVTGVALVVLVFHYNFLIYRFVAVRYIMYALVPLYSLLILHELNMLAHL